MGSTSLTTAALIVAAGRGLRATGDDPTLPKQYVTLAGVALLTHTIRRFLFNPRVDQVHVVIHASDEALFEDAVQEFGDRRPSHSFGGPTRQTSVLSGLEELRAHARRPDRVLIHDAARPFVDDAVIGRVIDALETNKAVIAADRVADTLKTSDAEGRIAGTVPRDNVWRAQTPQGFHFETILEAHRAAGAAGKHALTDDAAVAEFAGLDVLLVEGSPKNTKITTREDLTMAEAVLGASAPNPGLALEPRVGTGFDVHKFCEGDHVWLCGVRIPHDFGLLGHSDADAPMHALTDAILGALGDGDIGQHFPPSDPQWKGAASDIFLKDAVQRVAKAGGRITNVDVTLLCETPKIGPHRDVMRAKLAELLGISIGRVGVKATTTEALGFTGRREGLAALASATVMLPLAHGDAT